MVGFLFLGLFLAVLFVLLRGNGEDLRILLLPIVFDEVEDEEDIEPSDFFLLGLFFGILSSSSSSSSSLAEILFVFVVVIVDAFVGEGVVAVNTVSTCSP